MFRAVLLASGAAGAAMAQVVQVFPQQCTVSTQSGGSADSLTRGTGGCDLSNALTAQRGSRTYVRLSNFCTTSAELTMFSDDRCTSQVNVAMSIPVSSTAFYGQTPLTTSGGLYLQATSCSSVSIAFATSCPTGGNGGSTCATCLDGPGPSIWCGGAVQVCYARGISVSESPPPPRPLPAHTALLSPAHTHTTTPPHCSCS